MSALQQLWNGISPCMEPGVGDCVVWWDAWAVIAGASAAGVAIGALIVAWLGIGVTTASTFAVWKLGVAANSASHKAVKIAGIEAKRSRDESTRGGGLGKQLFLREATVRREVFDGVNRLQFPQVASAMDRMHFVDRKVSGSLLRAVSSAELARETYRFDGVGGATVNYADVYQSLSFLLPSISRDLDGVMDACVLAVKRMGIAASIPQSEGSPDLDP